MNNTTIIQVVCPTCLTLNRVPENKLGDAPKCGKCKNALISGQPVLANDQNFSRLFGKNDLPVVVDFWAPWCGPCKGFAPTFSSVASEMASRAIFVKLDTEENPQTAAQFQIRSIPTLMIFHQGKEVARLSGALPKPQFVQWLQQNMG